MGVGAWLKWQAKPSQSGADLGFWSGGQLSGCNSLSGSNPLTNRVLNKKINNLIYIYI
jgi:hypothetical protein